MKIYVLAYIFKVFLCSYVYDSCNACGSGSIFCSVEQWAPWGLCNSTCGGGVQERQKSICCDSKYHSLKGCLHGCNIPFSWWQANATEYKTCGKCHRGGTFDIKRNSCTCPISFGGSCCGIRTTLAVIVSSASQGTARKVTLLTTKFTTTPPMFSASPTTTLVSTTATSATITTSKEDVTSTTAHTTVLIPKIYTRLTTYESSTMKTVSFRTKTMASTLSMIRKGKRTTETIPTSSQRQTNLLQIWAIVVISVSCLGIVATCCCCLCCLVGSYNRKNRVTKFKPAEEKKLLFRLFICYKIV